MSWLYTHPKSGRWYLGWRVGHKLFNRSTGIKDTGAESRAEAEKQLATLDLMTQAKESGKLTEAFYRSLTGQVVIPE